MSVSVRPFGTLPSGAAVSLYTMTNASGASVSMTDYGAIVTAIRVPDRNGVLGDVCLGFDNLEKYAGPHGSMGDTIGRYGNRIGKGLLTIGGTTYQLALNDHGVNHLHGGNEGFNRKFWEVTVTEEADRDTLAFHTISPDGDENYPGTLDVTVCYSWDRDNNLIIRYQATTDADTVVNILRLIAAIIPLLFDIVVVLRVLSLLEIASTEDQEGIGDAAAKLSSVSCFTLAVTTGLCALQHVAQLVLLPHMTDASATVDIPVVSITFVVVILLFSRLLVENKQLRDDNSMII